MERVVYVLRIGHRIERDKRISTHVGLVARAFGAKGIFLVDVEPEVRKKIGEVTKIWGGPFVTETIEGDWRRFIIDWKNGGGIVIHLTMYGLPIDVTIDRIRERGGKMLVIVGAGKVPKEVYLMSDYNVSITNQPHSEVAALAIFLDRFYMGKEISLKFSDAKLKIIPSERGKKVVES
ncbi:MAG: tRNA (cytidine(56)-2'-O)-methyltransferase [Nitrososphaeria archaeon]